MCQFGEKHEEKGSLDTYIPVLIFNKKMKVSVGGQGHIWDLNTTCFLQMPYFGLKVTIWTWSAKPTLVSKLPLQLGSRRIQSTAKHSKLPKDFKFDSNNHSICDVFPPEFLPNIYAIQTPVTQVLQCNIHFLNQCCK